MPQMPLRLVDRIYRWLMKRRIKQVEARIPQMTEDEARSLADAISLEFGQVESGRFRARFMAKKRKRQDSSLTG